MKDTMKKIRIVDGRSKKISETFIAFEFNKIILE